MRLNKIILVVGRKATGKTTFCKQLLNIDKKKSIIVDSFDHPSYREYKSIDVTQINRWKSGRVRVYTSPPLESLNVIFNRCNTCTVVLEDAKRYIKPNVQDIITKAIIEHRNRDIDIIFMFHQLSDVPPYICDNHNSLVLFKTNDTMDVRLTKFSNWNIIKEAHERIMKNSNPFYNETITLQ